MQKISFPLEIKKMEHTESSN